MIEKIDIIENSCFRFQETSSILYYYYFILYYYFNIRGMAGKFVDTSAIGKSNAMLKKRCALFQAAISYGYISEMLCNLK